MKLNYLVMDILTILIDKKCFISLNEIHRSLNRHNVGLRSVQKELKKLIDTQRVAVEGKASSTKYCIENIQSFYRRFEFLHVFKNQELAGFLFRLEDRYRFYYDSNFLANQSPQIASLPLQLEPYDFEDIPAVFEENIPEGINKELLSAHHKTADEFEILSIIKDNIGDLQFSKTKELGFNKEDKPSFLSSLKEILGEHDKINKLEGFKLELGDEELFAETYEISKQELSEYHGISGFQYKKLVNIDFENKNIYSSNDTHLYILKPFSKIKADKHSESYFPHLSVNEHLFMSFAKNELNFRVPYSAIIKKDQDEEYHYVVKRFDRFGLYRYAKATFAVFLGLRSENKYNTTSEKLFKRIAKELKHPKERMELLRYYVYSVILQHEDMHTKNLSLIFDKNLVLLSPLYDIACTSIYDNAKKYDSFLTINGKRNQIRLKDFKTLCKILEVDFKEFKAEAVLIAQIYKDKLPSYIKELQKLGSLPFHKRKQVQKVGTDVHWKVDMQACEFSEVLETYHKKRVNELKKLNFLDF